MRVPFHGTSWIFMKFINITNFHDFDDFKQIHIIPTFPQSGIPGIRRMHETLQITMPNLCFWSPKLPFSRNSSFFAEIQLSPKKIFCAKSSDERKTGIPRGNAGMLISHYYLCFKKQPFYCLTLLFTTLPPRMVKMGENRTFRWFSPNFMEMSENGWKSHFLQLFPFSGPDGLQNL